MNNKLEKRIQLLSHTLTFAVGELQLHETLDVITGALAPFATRLPKDQLERLAKSVRYACPDPACGCNQPEGLTKRLLLSLHPHGKDLKKNADLFPENPNLAEAPRPDLEKVQGVGQGPALNPMQAPKEEVPFGGELRGGESARILRSWERTFCRRVASLGPELPRVLSGPGMQVSIAFVGTRDVSQFLAQIHALNKVLSDELLPTPPEGSKKRVVTRQRGNSVLTMIYWVKA